MRFDEVKKQKDCPVKYEPSSKKFNHPLNIMVSEFLHYYVVVPIAPIVLAPYTQVQHGRLEMLTHPVISSLLQHKWFHFGLWLYLLNLLVYIIFLGFLTAFALVDIPPQSNTCMCPSSMSTILLCSFHSYRLEACMMLIVQPSIYSWGWFVPTRKTRMLYIDGLVSYSCVVRYRV